MLGLLLTRGYPKMFMWVIIRVQRLRVRESNATQSVLPVWGRPVLALRRQFAQSPEALRAREVERLGMMTARSVVFPALPLSLIHI